MLLKFGIILRKMTTRIHSRVLVKTLKSLLLFTWCSSIVYADDTPDRVYLVVASADVQSIFNNGFAASGNNYNLGDLVTGNVGINSAYVPTSTNLLGTVAIAERVVLASGLTHFVVFAIRPDNTFYSINYALRYSMNFVRNTNQTLFMHLWLLYNEQILNDYDGWVTDSPTSGNQIEYATVYTLQNNIFVSTTLQNPHYIAGTPTVNPSGILILGLSPQSLFYQDLMPYHVLPGQLCNSFNSSSTANLLKQDIDHGVCTQYSYADLKRKLMKIFTTVM